MQTSRFCCVCASIVLFLAQLSGCVTTPPAAKTLPPGTRIAVVSALGNNANVISYGSLFGNRHDQYDINRWQLNRRIESLTRRALEQQEQLIATKPLENVALAGRVNSTFLMRSTDDQGTEKRSNEAIRAIEQLKTLSAAQGADYVLLISSAENTNSYYDPNSTITGFGVLHRKASQPPYNTYCYSVVETMLIEPTSGQVVGLAQTNSRARNPNRTSNFDRNLGPEDLNEVRRCIELSIIRGVIRTVAGLGVSI